MIPGAGKSQVDGLNVESKSPTRTTTRTDLVFMGSEVVEEASLPAACEPIQTAQRKLRWNDGEKLAHVIPVPWRQEGALVMSIKTARDLAGYLL
jgi:hypothetical protein